MDATNKPDLMKRFLAALIDGVAILVIYQIPAFGPWLALAYLLLRDGLDFEFVRHRSLGKHFMQLKPVTIEGVNSILCSQPDAIGILRWV